VPKRFQRIIILGVIAGIVAIGYLSGIFARVEALLARNQAFLNLSRGWSTVCLNHSVQWQEREQSFNELKSLGQRWLPANSENNLLVSAFVPWVVVTDTRRIEAEDPRWNTGSGRHQLTETYLVIYTKGGINVPILLGETSTVFIRIFGRHDAPPPVLLAVSIDDAPVGELAFKKGDDTWGSETLTTTMVGGCHWLSIEYINDFFDEEQQLDRNAYIDGLVVEVKDTEQ